MQSMSLYRCSICYKSIECPRGTNVECCSKRMIRVKVRNLRKVILRQLGFTSYSKYLASDLWSSLRKTVLERADYRCAICRNRATQVHHKNYNLITMEGKNLKSLVPLCADCHYGIEFSSSGVKNNIYSANKKLRKTRIW